MSIIYFLYHIYTKHTILNKTQIKMIANEFQIGTGEILTEIFLCNDQYYILFILATYIVYHISFAVFSCQMISAHSLA